MVEDCGELRLDRLQENGRVSPPIFVPLSEELILPLQNIGSADLGKDPVPKVGKDMGSDHVDLRRVSRELDLRLEISQILLDEEVELHGHIPAHVLQEFSLIFQCFLLGPEAPLALFLPIPLPVGVPEVYCPCSCLLVFRN